MQSHDIGKKIQTLQNRIGEGNSENRRPSNLTFAKRREVDIESEKLNQIKGRNRLIKINGKEQFIEIQDLEDLGELGNGTSGQVIKMKHRPTNKVIAVKQMRRTNNNEESKRIWNDLDVVLKSHDCPFIVQCLGYFITDADVWICMELMETCFDKLTRKSNQPVPENILGKVTVATVKALSYLKNVHGVIHRDVKPSNILVDTNGSIKLCDFGISGRLVESKAKTRSAGCTAYMAPERIDPRKPAYDIRADIWSLGITLVELATGSFPYKGCKTDFEVLTCVLDNDAPRLPTNQGFSIEFQSFVRDCLRKNYEDRPKYPELLQSDFIKIYEELDVDVAAWLMAQLYPTEANAIEQQRHSSDVMESTEIVLKSIAPPTISTNSSSSSAFTEVVTNLERLAQISPNKIADRISNTQPFLLHNNEFEFRPHNQHNAGEDNARQMHIEQYTQMNHAKFYSDFDLIPDRNDQIPVSTHARSTNPFKTNFDTLATIQPVINAVEIAPNFTIPQHTPFHSDNLMNNVKPAENPFLMKELNTHTNQYEASSILNDRYCTGQVTREQKFHMMEYHEPQHDSIIHEINNMRIEQPIHATDNGNPFIDSDKRIHLRYDEHAYEDLNGKRLLSPFLQRKSSLQNHQSRSTERNAHCCLAYRGSTKRPQPTIEHDCQDRINMPANTQMIPPKPKGSTSPIVLQRFHHQQSQLREREAFEKTRTTHLRNFDLHSQYNYNESASIYTSNRIHNNPFQVLDNGGSNLSTQNNHKDFIVSDLQNPHNGQHFIRNESRLNSVPLSSTRTKQIQCTSSTGRDRDEHGWFNALASMVKKSFASYVKPHAGESLLSKNGNSANSRKLHKLQSLPKDPTLSPAPASLPSSPNFNFRSPRNHEVLHRMSPLERRHQSPDPPPRFNKGQSPLVLRRKLELEYASPKYVSPISSRRIIPSSPLPPPRKLAGTSANLPLQQSSRITETRNFRLINNNE